MLCWGKGVLGGEKNGSSLMLGWDGKIVSAFRNVVSVILPGSGPVGKPRGKASRESNRSLDPREGT